MDAAEALPREQFEIILDQFLGACIERKLEPADVAPSRCFVLSIIDGSALHMPQRYFEIIEFEGMKSKVSPSIEQLRDALRDVPHGPLETDDAARITYLLAECWEQIPGADETSMQAYKLSRAERLSWRSPCLSFEIERHGGTVLGSKRAELQHWTVDLETLKATYTEGKYRQLTPAAPRLDVRPLAKAVCDAVQQGPETDAELVRNGTVVWQEPTQLTIKPSLLIDNGGFRQTIESRRKRLRNELIKQMSTLGWRLESRQRFMIFSRTR